MKIENWFCQTFITTIKARDNRPKASHIKLFPGRSLLFVFFIESLSQGVTQNNNMSGIQMLVQEYKISLLEEDVYYKGWVNQCLSSYCTFLLTGKQERAFGH